MENKKDYWYYKEMGICWYCKVEKVEKGIACNKCKEEKRIKQRELVKFHREKQYCYRCGNKLTKYDKGVLCGACKYDDRVTAQMKREILHEKGLCVRCRKPKINKESFMCETCREKQNKYMREKYRKNKRGEINE